MAQIAEPKVSNLCSLEQFMETLVRPLTPTGCSWLGRQDAVRPNDSRIPPDFLCEFRWHWDEAYLAFFKRGPYDVQSLAVENVSSFKAKNLPAPHTG